jgi:type IV pilus assembly protein PilC
MEFAFTAKSRNGVNESGKLIADTLDEARSRLRTQGLFPLDVRVSTASGEQKTLSLSFSRKGVKKNDILMLTSQLSIMCQAGIDVAEALGNVAKRCPNPTLAGILSEIHDDVSAGVSVSETLKKHSKVFGGAYVASIAAGEASGTLTEVLKRLAELLKHEIRLRATIRSVLAYPLVLSGVAFIVIAVLVFFVLPQFAVVFEDLGSTPPVHTQMLLATGAFLRTHFLMLAVGCSITAGLCWRYMMTERAARYWDSTVLTFWLSRGATQSLITGRTFRLLGTMLQSGIPLLEGLQLCRESVRNRVYRDLFDAMSESVVNGGQIGPILDESNVVPDGAAQMVATAEQTGRLGEVINTIGEFYEDEGEQKIRGLAKLLEPLVIVVMGAVVGFVVMAVMLPLLDVSASSR